MKKIFILLLLTLCSYQFALAQCQPGNRYRLPVFGYDSVIDLKFGANVTASSSVPQDLLLDIYVPTNDTFSQRPVIFFTHGGSFIFGSRKDGDVVYLCREFAKRGFVTVSIEYRLGFESFDASGAIRGVWRAMQDSRAAVRYIKSNAATYKLDTNMIIFGGSSAGAFCALNVAFLDQANEVPQGVDTSAYIGPNGTGLGNFRGTTNNLPNSDNVHAVINLCGALGDTSWIQAKDSAIQVISLHGTADATVPYGSDIIKLLGTIPILEVDGSASIRQRLNNMNHENYFFTYCGQDHVPYAGLANWQRAWMDTTVRFITKHIYEDLFKCGNSGYYTPEVDSADCPASGIGNNLFNAVKLYPNPSSGSVTVFGLSADAAWSAYALDGKLYREGNLTQFNKLLDLEGLPRGTYIVRLSSGRAEKFVKIQVD
jgi:para-nitrobenzyl esterase